MLSKHLLTHSLVKDGGALSASSALLRRRYERSLSLAGSICKLIAHVADKKGLWRNATISPAHETSEATIFILLCFNNNCCLPLTNSVIPVDVHTDGSYPKVDHNLRRELFGSFSHIIIIQTGMTTWSSERHASLEKCRKYSRARAPTVTFS